MTQRLSWSGDEVIRAKAGVDSDKLNRDAFTGNRTNRDQRPRLGWVIEPERLVRSSCDVELDRFAIDQLCESVQLWSRDRCRTSDDVLVERQRIDRNSPAAQRIAIVQIEKLKALGRIGTGDIRGVNYSWIEIHVLNIGNWISRYVILTWRER